MPGLFGLVAGPGGTMPIDPQHGWLNFTAGNYKQAAPLGGVRLRGRTSQNEWYEQHLGRQASVPTSDIVRDVAIQSL